MRVCALCERRAWWVRMGSDPSAALDALPVCETCKQQSERHDRKDRRYTFVPIRVDEPVLAGVAPPPPPPATVQGSLLDTPTAPVGHRHPETAKAAAARALPRTGSRRREAWELIQARGGLTAEEVGIETGWPHQTYSATVSTLAADGLVIDSGDRRPTLAGNPAIVYRAVLP
jgi:hypothetical protein